MQTLQHDKRGVIGIITGSGPDAGIDLWEKVLTANKALFNGAYRGDLDAPHVNIVSLPTLGLSMELEKNDAVVWEALSDAAKSLSEHTDYFAIACNTLNFYQNRLNDLNLTSKLISFSDVVVDLVSEQKLEKVALLGSRPVTDLGDWSPYTKLLDVVEVEVPKDTKALHELIYDVKALGADHSDISRRFADILEQLESDTVLLACTELPLIKVSSHKQLIDVTDLVATELAKRSVQLI